jgi:hypothetical protein
VARSAARRTWSALSARWRSLPVLLDQPEDYAPSRKDDMHVGRAIELLKDDAVKAEVETRGPEGSLDEALETWRKLKADHPLPK